jgi:hypothetical protein
MQSPGTACFAGLCLLASCVHAQPLACPLIDSSTRGQYCVSFKIVAGKLAVDRDGFHVAQSLQKFQGAIRGTVKQAIGEITNPLPQSQCGDCMWADYITAFEAWTAANPDRLDLGTIFSSDYLFADILKQMPDSGLVLNEDQIDPSSGYISFSILPLFDSKAVEIELPTIIESRQSARMSQLRKRLAKLNASLWSSAAVRKAIGPLYVNLGLAPQILVLPRNQTIQIVEGPRIASIMLPADQVPARDLDRVLWDLLDTGHFRMAMRAKNNWAPNRVLDLDRDLAYLEGDEPYAIQNQLQALQLLISPLGYVLSTQPSAHTGSSPYVDLLVQKASKKLKRHLGAGFAYTPGQGFSTLGNLGLPSLTMSGGGPSGVLGSAEYSSDFLGFEQLNERVSASLNAFTSLQRNRFLNGVKVTEQSTAELATVEWQPWRGLDGNTLMFQLVPSHALILNETVNSLEPGVQFLHNDLTSEYPWRILVSSHVLIGSGFAEGVISANTHRSFDHWEYDLSGRFENAFGAPPIFELPSFGGADTVRGFRADDAIGRRLWSTQPELWLPAPRFQSLKIATFCDVGGAYQTTGSRAGMREGPGLGLRLDVHVAVLKFDWAYGLGDAATGGSRGKFYFTVAMNGSH